MVPRMPDVDPDILVVSNRGPLSFSRNDNGELETKRGAGGLVSTLGPGIAERRATWIAAAISDEDREAAGQGMIEAEGFRLRSLVVDPDEYRMFYDVVANSTLWFMHHNLFDLPRRPRIDRRWREAWDAYRSVNDTFCNAVCEEASEGSVVLVQDYHFSLMGERLAQERPDLRAVHFHHTPFCEPSALRTLPDHVADELMRGLAGFRACGFHSSRWAACYEAGVAAQIGEQGRTFVAPAAADHLDIEKVAAGEECAQEMAALEEAIAGRKLIVRVDRIELSKNLLRGFLAFDDLLRARPDLVGGVTFGAFIYPSREALPEYLAYRQEVEGLAARLNQRWAKGDWMPILLDTSDFFPRSVAALRRYDVLLVNPIRDGLNLVAKEGALLNERDGVIALSREAGAWEELSEGALEVNPFDVAGTCEALSEALDMEPDERARRATVLRRAAGRRTPTDWLHDQLRAAGAL
ncbi:MAG: trehalose 6-phosphate synthase [Actinomycetota bacterium]|jgi:trehalose 6-phosphate synthase